MQHATDEKVSKIMAQETVLLEREVATIMKSFEAALEEEEALTKRVHLMEAELNSQESLDLVHGFADKASEIHKELEGSMDVIRGTLEGLVGQTMHTNADEEKERALVGSFNSDVERICNNANETMDEMSLELEKIARGMKIQIPKR
jgi:hypothetical protein